MSLASVFRECAPSPRLTFLQIGLPAVATTKPAVKKAVALFARNFEVDETQTLLRDDGLLTLAAYDGCLELHKSPPKRTSRLASFHVELAHVCSLLGGELISSNRWPRNFSNSSPERNRSSVQESTSLIQPSNLSSDGFVSGPSWTTNAPRMN
jgi:hypothetical protein